MIHNFDTSGFQPVGDREWQDPRTLDTIAVKYVDKPLNEPIWLEDVPGMQRSLAHGYAPHGCLIEATPILLGGVPAVYQLAKMPHPGQPTGAIFLSSIYLAKATCYAVLIYSAPETGITGMRETQLFVQLGMPKNWGLPHPYDPALESKLPFHRGDDPAWDPQFPDHPLTRVRTWVNRAVPITTVDPAFAALPDFTPSRPPTTPQPPTAQPAPPPTQQPIQPPAAQPAQPSGALPPQPPAAQPAQPLAEPPAALPAESPAQSLAEPFAAQSAQPPAAQFAQPAAAQPAQLPVAEPAQPPAAQLAEPSAALPAEQPAQPFAEPSAAQPAQPPVAQFAQPAAAQPIQPSGALPAQSLAAQLAQPAASPAQQPVVLPAQQPAPQSIQSPVSSTEPAGDPVWRSLAEAMPDLVTGDDEPGSRVWVAEPGTGRGVLFGKQADGVEVSVRIPVDADAAARLDAVVRAQPADLWHARQGAIGAWVAGWPHAAPREHQERVAASAVAVLRDGFGADPARLRVRAWGDAGPRAGNHGQRSDRPTDLGLPAACTDWDEFTARLDWVLQTLPSNGVLILNVPNVNWAFVQFWQQRRLSSEASPRDVAGLGAAEFHQRMTGLGWQQGADANANWTGPADHTDHGTAGVPARAVRTFRDVFGVAGPQALTVSAFRHGHRDTLDHLAAELGLTRAN